MINVFVHEFSGGLWRCGQEIVCSPIITRSHTPMLNYQCSHTRGNCLISHSFRAGFPPHQVDCGECLKKYPTSELGSDPSLGRNRNWLSRSSDVRQHEPPAHSALTPRLACQRAKEI